MREESEELALVPHFQPKYLTQETRLDDEHESVFEPQSTSNMAGTTNEPDKDSDRIDIIVVDDEEECK